MSPKRVAALRERAARLRSALQGDDIDAVMDTAWDSVNSMEFVANRLDQKNEKKGKAL
jgi:hypothetical protein